MGPGHIKRNLRHHRGDTQSFTIPFSYKVEDIKALLFEIKTKLNSKPVIRMSKANDPESFYIDPDESFLTFTLNHGKGNELNRTDFLYVPDVSRKIDLLYEIQLTLNDGTVRTLCGQNLVVTGDVITQVEGMTTGEDAEINILQGVALAVLTSWKRSNAPSAANPLATVDDLKRAMLIANELQYEVHKITSQIQVDRRLDLRKAANFDFTPRLVIQGEANLHYGVNGHYSIDGNGIKWGDYLAESLARGIGEVLVVYKSVIEDL